MDLETYISNYTGHTKVARLLFIADNSKEHELEALRMAVEEVKNNSTNTTLYQQLCAKIGDRLGPSYSCDLHWLQAVEKKAQQQQEKLEQELNGYKTNLIKESIRVGHTDLGDFFYERGDLHQAFRCYLRTRDYCTTSKHIIAMCLNVIKVTIEMNNFAHVANYIAKAEQTPDVQDALIIAKLKCCSALAHLDGGKYRMAARKFLDTSFDLNANFAEVIAPQDVACYGGLCALATFDRPELKSKVIDNNQFKNFLELVPDIRELINDFYTSRYASCLNRLVKIKPDLLLDMHLARHVEGLYEQIRCKALIQYSSPFVSVSLLTMSEAFNTPLPNLEHELASLIIGNHIQARIDSHNKILYARHADQRSGTFDKSLTMGSDYVRSTKAVLLRVNLLRNNFIVRPPSVHAICSSKMEMSD